MPSPLRRTTKGKIEIERARRSGWNSKLKEREISFDPDSVGKTRHEHHHGTILKEHHLTPIMHALEHTGKLGKVIVDVGSGSLHVNDARMGTRLRAFYPTHEKKVVRVDVAFKQRSHNAEGMLEIQADIENTKLDTLEQKKRLLAIAKFLEIDPRKKAPAVDSMVVSDILDYVNYRRAILGLMQFIKPNGRIIIYNRPNRGFPNLFSKKRIRDNDKLLAFLKRAGFEIEFTSYETPEMLGEALGWEAVDYVPRHPNQRTIVVVARKKPKI